MRSDLVAAAGLAPCSLGVQPQSARGRGHRRLNPLPRLGQPIDPPAYIDATLSKVVTVSFLLATAARMI